MGCRGLECAFLLPLDTSGQLFPGVGFVGFVCVCICVLSFLLFCLNYNFPFPDVKGLSGSQDIGVWPERQMSEGESIGVGYEV